MDLVVTLVNWDPKGDYERLGFEEKTIDILGVNLPHLTIPVSPGRSVATIVEVAARNQILKIMGHHSDFGMLENLTAPADKAVRLRRSKKMKEMKDIRLVVISGPSGAGKSTAIKVLEDLGFFAWTTCRLRFFRSFLNYSARPRA